MTRLRPHIQALVETRKAGYPAKREARNGVRLRRGSAGFTLIEAVVAVSMFLILLGAVMSVFTTFTRQQRYGITQATLLGEAQNALETLDREVRTGFGNTFSCAASQEPGSGRCDSIEYLFLKNQNGEDVVYRYDRSQQRLFRNGEPVMGANIAVTDFALNVARSAVGGSPPILLWPQGLVVVHMKVCPKRITDESRCIFLQTTLTSRQYAPYTR